MAIGTQANFVIYEEEYYGGQYEILAQNVDVFNAASNGAMAFVTRDIKGQYEKESFFQDMTLINRRDPTSVSSATDTPMTQAELVGVKINDRIGPVAQTLNAFEKIGLDESVMSFLLGQMVARHKLRDYANTALLATTAALKGQTALKLDITGESTKSITATALARLLALMGDASGRIVALVMHSTIYWDLVKAAISDKLYEEAGIVVYGGTPGTFNRPVVVTDAPALKDDNGSLTDTYNTLGLVAGAVECVESEGERMVAQIVTGLQNLAIRYQGEHAFNLRQKGFAWDITNGGANPNDSALGTSTNWDKVATDNKDLGGAILITQAA